MSTYVMSDIHGCYDELMVMLGIIQFSKDDQLIIAGDYIDRGKQSYEMLRWIEAEPLNVTFLKGNHDVEFIYCIDLMRIMFDKKQLPLDNWEATTVIYELLVELSNTNQVVGAFDYYGTIGKLIRENNVTMLQLNKWSECIRRMSFVKTYVINKKSYLIVHAGYIENLVEADTEDNYEDVEDFYLNARDDAYMCGGKKDCVVISGHTPTVFEDEMPYNDGFVYSFYDDELNCRFYNIDCGCAYKEKYSHAKLACIRLEDEEIFYVN